VNIVVCESDYLALKRGIENLPPGMQWRGMRTAASVGVAHDFDFHDIGPRVSTLLSDFTADHPVGRRPSVTGIHTDHGRSRGKRRPAATPFVACVLVSW
jgi:hypothetical protein